jgi:hypothetical protein
MPTRFLLLVTCLLGVAWSAAPGTQPAPTGAAPVDPEPHLSFHFDSNMRFGLVVLKDAAGKAINKRLTYATDGATNSTVVRIDGKDVEFGGPAGKWLEKASAFTNGSKSIWATAGVQVSQSLEIVPSQQPVEVAPGVRKRLLDTCLITYAIVNTDNKDHTVGLRIQVDTLIGSNDGVPFTVPTLTGLVNTFKDFSSPKEVPEFIQALEVPDLLKPGTVGHMTLKVGGGLEPPSRVSLTHWPGNNFMKWDVPVVNMSTDSAVVIYWNADRALKPREKRNLGFAYGLGKVSSSEGTGKLALTVNGSFLAREPFTVTAYIQDPAKGQTLKLELPAGLERVGGKETETVPAPSAGPKQTSVINWKVKAPQPGTFVLKARSSTGVSQSQPVTIRPGSIPDRGKLTALTVSGPLALNQVFTVTATVKNPLPDQNLTLTLPQGLEPVEGSERQTVPQPVGRAEESTVAWKVKADNAGTFTVHVRSSSNEDLSKSITITGPKTDLDLLDARRALQMSVGNLAEDPSLDMDADGRVTSLDAALILQRVADQTRKGK